MRVRLLWISLLFALSVSALACSGVGAQDSIHSSIVVSYVCAGVYGLAFAGSWAVAKRMPTTGPVTLFIGLFLIGHPAWWISPWNGDCGMIKSSFSILASFAAWMAVLLQWAWSRRVRV